MGSDLELTKSAAKFEPPLTIQSPGEGLRVRALCLEDYDRGFLQILGQLTSVGDISREQWEQRWTEMRQCPNTYYVIVIEDTTVPGGKVIGAATLSGRGSSSTPAAPLADSRTWLC